MNSSKENLLYIGKYLSSQPLLYTKLRVLVLGFNEVLFLILYPLLNLYLRRKPPWHSLRKIHVPATDPFVGRGEDPGFNSKSAPTSPSYWPFWQHLWSIFSLTQINYEGVAGWRCLQPEEYQVGLLQQQHIMHLSFNKIDLSFIAIDLI